MPSHFRLVVAACLSVAACSLATSLDGLTGGGNTQVDGGETSDAATIDSAPAPDAATDAGNSIDASSTPSPCNVAHTFCADFDESSNVPAYDGLADPDHDLSIDTTVSRSSPNSLQALLPNGGNAGTITTNLITGTHAHVAFDFMLQASSDDTIIFTLYSPNGDGVDDHRFYVETYAYAMQFTEAVTPDDGGSTNYLATALGSGAMDSVWSHLDFMVDGTTGQVTTTFDGVAETHSMQQPFSADAFSLVFGEIPNGPSASVKAHFDNIVIDIN